MAMSDVATWGTQESELISETDMPSTSDDLPTLVDSSSDEEIDFDDAFEPPDPPRKEESSD